MELKIETPTGEPSSFTKEARKGRAHYYASSASNYRVSVNMLEAMEKVKKIDRLNVKEGGMVGTNMTVWWVPLPIDSSYNISDYAPQVDGAIQLASVDYGDELRAYHKRINRK